MKWHTYHISPIDWGWIHLKTVKETLAAISEYEHIINQTDDITSRELITFISAWEDAKKFAKKEMWEGDFSEGPCVFWIPTENEFSYGFAFKQNNNGSTFIVSPIRLCWLDEYTF